MFKPIKIVESKYSGDGPRAFLFGMSFCSLIQNEEDHLRSAAVKVGCQDPGTPGGKDLGSRNPRWRFFTCVLFALQCFQDKLCGWVFQSIPSFVH